jgi:hypothetical protein
LDAFALLAGEHAPAVVLHLVQPAGSGARAIGRRGIARANEADWRISSSAGCRGAPSYVPQVKAAAVMAMRIIGAQGM